MLILAGYLIIISSSSGNYIAIPKYTHSHTKAICNSENFCQDYEIFCQNQEVIGMSPITGAAIQFPENWEDPRNDKIKNSLCWFFFNLFLLRNPTHFTPFHQHVFPAFWRAKMIDCSVIQKKGNSFWNIILFPAINTFRHFAFSLYAMYNLVFCLFYLWCLRYLLYL